MCDHDHAALESATRLIVDTVLASWHFPPRTRIAIAIRCFQDTDVGNYYGAIGWSYLPYQDFLLQIRCDIGDERLEWLVRHELLEAMLAEYADLFERYAKLDAGKREEHQRVRDNVIEWLLAIISPEYLPPPRVIV